jgi:glycosyltransferase involved in cell wall biosynthesis
VPFKILFLLTDPFGMGGVQSDMLAMAEHLPRKGHEVLVATRPGVLVPEVAARGGRFLALDCHFRGPVSFLQAALRLRRLIAAETVDLVAPQSIRTAMLCHFGLRMLPFGYRSPATGRRLPIVATVHNVHSPGNFRYGGRILNRCADRVTFESHYERNRLLDNGLLPDRSCVIHSGVDTARFCPREPDAELLGRYGLRPGIHRVFGIVARLSEEKGHGLLLEAFARVHGADPATRLLVVGDGPLLAATRAHAAALGLDDAVIFAGPQRNIPEMLALMDVFVLASTRESFPLAAREAMAAGRAVIAPRIGGCPEVVDHGRTGLLYEAGAVAALAEAMGLLITGERYREYGRAARAVVEERFSLVHWIDSLEAVYARQVGLKGFGEAAGTCG